MSIHQKIKPDIGQIKFLCEAGQVLASKGLYVEACDVFQGVVALAPERAIGYTFLGDAYLEQGKFDEALKTHQKAVEVEPSNTFAQVHLGEAFLFKKQREKALSVLRKVVDSDPRGADGALARQLIKGAEQGLFAKL